MLCIRIRFGRQVASFKPKVWSRVAGSTGGSGTHCAWTIHFIKLNKKFKSTSYKLSSYLVIEHKLSSHVVFEEVLQVVLRKKSIIALSFA